ncbi:nucleotide disphospho-sugar-binding domain-containing protein [Streptomyces sp. 8K308]|uniref:glycosyltransferase n=1 Tax=Streptomyces sp. 8K308 TaxID=2530388 RepID=UPI0032677DCC
MLQDMTGDRNGIGGFKRIIRELFVEPVPEYARDLSDVIDEFRPDVIVADHCFLAGPMVASRRGIGSVVYVVGPLAVSSVDTAPSGTGLAPSSSPLGRLRNRTLSWLVANVVFRDVQQALRRAAAAIDFPALDDFLTDWTVRIADRYLVAAIPEFEYPRSDLPPAVEFIGPMLPAGVDDWSPPDWWPELRAARRAGRPVVLVTQGTAATDPRQLVLPTISALADTDALVVATALGDLPDDTLPRPRPAGLRLERFVPYTELLPLTDVMVTNGGYGGVQMSLAYGVPLVTAGRSEDKMEVNRRVAWSGAGISLNTSNPRPERLRSAVTSVLEDSRYRERAQRLKAAYARYPGAPRAAEAILETAAGAAPLSAGDEGRPR